MDRYTKGFVVASLACFAMASSLGLWLGSGEAPSWARFAHVHLNLLGFLAMMIYGVGYFVLPRFNARELRWPSWVPLHFWVANAGLVGMIAAYPESPSPAFAVFTGLSVASVFLFAVNLGATVLLPERGAKGEALHGEAVPASPAPAAAEIGPDTRVGEVLTRWPWTLDVFVASGFGGLADPAHREQVKQMPITVGMACQRHGVEVGPMVEKLRAVAGRVETAIRADQVLGEILAAHPQTEPVFRKYYGSGCFSCPGQATETVKQSAMIHNVDLEQLLEELNRAAG